FIKDSVSKSQPKITATKHKHWMSDSTWELVEQRRKLKIKGADARELNSLSSKIQAACRKDKNLALQNICEELEYNAQRFETKDLYMKIRTITRQFKPKNWAIENSAGNCVTEIKEIVEVWRKYCVTLFADTYDASDHISITADSEREPGILRDEIRAAIKHLQQDKAVGTDEIPIEVIRDIGEFGVDILHIICSQIWDTGDTYASLTFGKLSTL
ncbi:uncharacterized protein LOC112457698, partial [Temnothorax curvispinosus]|uniref:Uncharacterized protein LOC112457698 n=1 Tax=Temnothorax curvispinosus TaxID=300111 RepID=A0A6J1Q4Q0_9HYME